MKISLYTRKHNTRKKKLNEKKANMTLNAFELEWNNINGKRSAFV